MPQIKQYDAPDRRITPEEKGYSAFETAGRRVGPLYNQAGNDVRDIGRLTNEIYKQRMWPWDFLVADDRRKGGGGGAGGSGGGGGGGGFKTQGFESDPFGQFAAHGQTSRGAGHIGSEFIEPMNGTPIAKNAEFIDGSGQPIDRGQIGRGLYTPNGGLKPYAYGEKNPYAPNNSWEYGRAPPPPIPTGTGKAPVGPNGQVGERLGPPMGTGQDTPIDPYGDASMGRFTMYRNPNYDPSDKHSPQQVPVWEPTDYGGGSAPAPATDPISRLSDWVSGGTGTSTPGTGDGSGSYDETGQY